MPVKIAAVGGGGDYAEEVNLTNIEQEGWSL
jgi:hypothetical protein